MFGGETLDSKIEVSKTVPADADINSLAFAGVTVPADFRETFTKVHDLIALYPDVDRRTQDAIKLYLNEVSRLMPDLLLDHDESRLADRDVVEFVKNFRVHIPRKSVCTVCMPATMDWLEIALQANEIVTRLDGKPIVKLETLEKWTDIPAFTNSLSEDTLFTIDAFVIGSGGISEVERKKFRPLAPTQKFLAAYCAYAVVTGKDMLDGKYTRTDTRTLHRGNDGLQYAFLTKDKQDWSKFGVAVEIHPPLPKGA